MRSSMKLVTLVAAGRDIDDSPPLSTRRLDLLPAAPIHLPASAPFDV